MNMRISSSLFFLLLTFCAQAAKFEITQDHLDALYCVGEEATIGIAVKDDLGGLVASGSVAWKLDNFGSVGLGSGEVDLSHSNPFVVKGTMSEPGFLRLTVWDATNRATWGVGYDVGRIRQAEPCPKDFDDYWTFEKQRLMREVPLDAQCVRDKRLSKKEYDCFRVSFATFNGKRVYGFLTVPTDNSLAPFGVKVIVPGAGPGVIDPLSHAHSGEVTLVMNVHCFEPAPTPYRQRIRMEEQNEALAKRYGFSNLKVYCGVIGIAESREDYWYHDVMLGINRAVDWVCERKDVDLSRVSYSGSSQGGGFGLFLNYLNGHFTRAFVAVCALTGHYGFRQGRQDGWPRLVFAQDTAKRAVAERYASYFDGVNFAARIHHPIRFIVGFADNICAPVDVYAAYNVCPAADKAIVNAIGSGHDWAPWYESHRGKGCIDFDEWLCEHDKIKPIPTKCK